MNLHVIHRFAADTISIRGYLGVYSEPRHCTNLCASDLVDLTNSAKKSVSKDIFLMSDTFMLFFCSQITKSLVKRHLKLDAMTIQGTYLRSAAFPRTTSGCTSIHPGSAPGQRWAVACPRTPAVVAAIRRVGSPAAAATDDDDDNGGGRSGGAVLGRAQPPGPRMRCCLSGSFR